MRDGKGWHAHGQAFPVALGRTGSAWGLHPAQADGPQKQEGDGRSPAGVFALGSAFGYAVTRPGTAMPYQPMLNSSYCMDVPSSPFYNRIVDEKKVGSAAVKGSTEPMRLDLHNKGDVRYQEGFVIAHNPDNQPGKGSCIFAHLWRQLGEATAGCTAMPQARMQALLDWLRPQDAALRCCRAPSTRACRPSGNCPHCAETPVERAGRTAAAARGQPLADRRPVDQRCDRQRHLPAAGRHRRPARPLQPGAWSPPVSSWRCC